MIEQRLKAAARLALVLVGFGLAGCTGAPAAPLTRPAPFSPATGPALETGTPDGPLECAPQAPVPATAFDWHSPRALVTVAQAGRAAIAAVTADGSIVPVTAPGAMGAIRMSADASTLAVAHEQGPDARDNRIEIHDLVSGRTWRVRPAEGCAVFGFALDPSGQRVAYTQVAMRGKLKPAYWQLTIADRDSPQSHTFRGRGETALVPLAWPEPNRILLQAEVPFQTAGEQGVWSVRPDGSDLHQLLGASDYVGEPAASPDGRTLIFLSSEVDALPKLALEVPGEPAANRLFVQDLASGQVHGWASTEGALRGPVWSEDRVVFAEGAWAQNQFRYNTIRRAKVGGGEPQILLQVAGDEAVTSLQACGNNTVLYSVQSERGESVRRWKDGSEQTLAAPSQAQVRMLRCME